MIINKSKTYLLPLLSEFVYFDERFYPQLENTYIYDDLGKYKDCIIISHLFNIKAPDFTAYEHKFTDNDLFVDLVDNDNKVLYIFKFPNEYMKEYNLYKEGKYSQFSKDSKELILRFFTKIFHNNLNAIDFLLGVKNVLFKDKKLKLEIEQNLGVKLPTDAELSAIMEENEETLELSKIKEKNNNLLDKNAVENIYKNSIE